MKRRAFLATTAVVATTGCIGRADGADGDEPTMRADTATPGGETACPTVHESVDATVCAGGATDRGVSVVQSADRVTDGEVLELTLVNEAAESVGLNPYEWAVYRETSEGWAPVDPEPIIEPWVVLDAGDRLQWRLGVGDASPDTDGERVYGGSTDLDPGEYAFGATADVAGDRVSLVAPFTVE